MFDYIPISTSQQNFSILCCCDYENSLFLLEHLTNGQNEIQKYESDSNAKISKSVARVFPCMLISIVSGKHALFIKTIDHRVFLLNKQNLSNLETPVLKNVGEIRVYENFLGILTIDKQKISILAQTSRKTIETLFNFETKHLQIQEFTFSKQYLAVKTEHSYMYSDLNQAGKNTSNLKFMKLDFMQTCPEGSLYSDKQDPEIFSFVVPGDLLFPISLKTQTAVHDRPPLSILGVGGVFFGGNDTFYRLDEEGISIGFAEKVLRFELKGVKSLACVKLAGNGPGGCEYYAITENILWKIKRKSERDVLYEAAKSRKTLAASYEAYEKINLQHDDLKIDEIKTWFLADIWGSNTVKNPVELKTEFKTCVEDNSEFLRSKRHQIHSGDLTIDQFELLAALDEETFTPVEKFIIDFKLENEYSIDTIPDDLSTEFLTNSDTVLRTFLKIKHHNFDIPADEWALNQVKTILTKSFKYLDHDEHVDFVKCFPESVMPQFFKFRKRHIKIFPDLAILLPYLSKSQIQQFITHYDANTFADRDRTVLLKYKVESFIEKKEYQALIKTGFLINEITLTDEQRSKIENNVDSEILIEHYLRTDQYARAYQLTKKLHSNEIDLIKKLELFCKSVPDRKTRQDLLLDVLYNETVSSSESCQVINRFSSDLAVLLDDILENMPELGGVQLRNLTPTFEQLSNTLLRLDFLNEVSSNFS